MTHLIINSLHSIKLKTVAVHTFISSHLSKSLLTNSPSTFFRRQHLLHRSRNSLIIQSLKPASHVQRYIPLKPAISLANPVYMCHIIALRNIVKLFSHLCTGTLFLYIYIYIYIYMYITQAALMLLLELTIRKNKYEIILELVKQSLWYRKNGK